MIFKLVWRNLWRNPRRTSITIASVMFAVLLSIAMMSLQSGVYDNLVKNLVGYYSGYIQVHKGGYWDEKIIDNAMYLDDSLEVIIKKNDFVTGVVPRIESFALSSGMQATHGCMVTGIDPLREDQLTRLNSRIIAGSYFSAGHSTALIAEGLAKKLKIGINDSVVLLGQGFQGNMAAGKYKISGILRFGNPELNNAGVYLPLATAQEWLSAPGMVTSVSLVISDVKSLEKKRDQLKAILSDYYEVMTWKEMMPVIVDMIRVDAASLYIFMAVLYLIIAFGIFGTILMMTNERKHELGMLVAIGMKRSRIAWMLVGESVMISMLGTMAGLILTLPIIVFLRDHPIHFSGDMAKAYESYGFEAIMPAVLDPGIFFSQAAVVLVIALAIGIYPLFFLKRLDILKAIRQ